MKLVKPLIALTFLGALAAAPAAEAVEKIGTKSIAWHGTWKGGLAEAQRTGRPILLISGVPQCHNVPGVW
jgi:hypothetical protein